MSKCQKMLLNNSPATFLQEEIFSFYQTRAANHITEQKEACIYSLTKLSQAKSVPSKGAECLVDLCFKFLGLTQAFKADLFFEASANLWTFNFRVPKKNESIQETPRAKKQVNASLSLYETEINGTDGCIYVFLKCLACPFFKNKTKQNTNTVDIRPVAIRISQHGLSTAQNFSNTQKETQHSSPSDHIPPQQYTVWFVSQLQGTNSHHQVVFFKILTLIWC